MKKPAADASWHREIKQYYRFLHSEFDIPQEHFNLVTGLCDQLNLCIKCRAEIEDQGITYKTTGGLIRQHPACTIWKNAWAGALQGIKILGLDKPDEEPKRPARPAI